MIKAVLFDLDGTLINTIDDLGDACNFALAKMGFQLHNSEEYKLMVGNGMRKLVERSLPENERTDDKIDKALEFFFEYYNVHNVDKTCSYDGVEELINELQKTGIKIAVVTNKHEPSAISILDKLYKIKFDAIVGNTSTFPAKPDPATANHAMSLLGVTPDECLFVGDSCVDMQTACNCGAVPVGVLWGFRGREELEQNGARYIIEAPHELLDIIKG